jgi:hypothetical protein
MTLSQSAYTTLYAIGALGALYWCCLGIAWLYRRMTRPEVLPQPQPDERDVMAEFHRILNRGSNDRSY